MAIPYPVVIVKAQVIVKPISTPPVPAEAMSFPDTHKVSSNLFLHPVPNVCKTLGGVSNPEVIYPPSQNGVYEFYYPA